MTKKRLSYQEIKELLTERSLLEAEFGEDPVAEKKFDFFINSKQEKQDDAFRGISTSSDEGDVHCRAEEWRFHLRQKRVQIRIRARVR